MIIKLLFATHLRGTAWLEGCRIVLKLTQSKLFWNLLTLTRNPTVEGLTRAIQLIYFLPKFTTMSAPKKDVHNYDSRSATSLVGEFNLIQVEEGNCTISNFSASSWLKKERPNHAIYPHKANYCAKTKASIKEKQTTINRKLQGGNVDAAET